MTMICKESENISYLCSKFTTYYALEASCLTVRSLQLLRSKLKRNLLPIQYVMVLCALYSLGVSLFDAYVMKVQAGREFQNTTEH